MLESLFDKFEGLQEFSRKHRFFSAKFAKFSRTPILKNICERLLLDVFQKIVVQKNFAKFTRKYPWQKFFNTVAALLKMT